jgi:hypothetical protein
MQVRQDMDVILRAIYLIEDAILIFDNAPDILVEIFLMIWVNYRHVIFRTEDDVVEDLTMTAHIHIFLFNPCGVAGYDAYCIAPQLRWRLL